MQEKNIDQVRTLKKKIKSVDEKISKTLFMLNVSNEDSSNLVNRLESLEERRDELLTEINNLVS